MIRFIYKVIPVPVFITERFIPRRYSGMSLGVMVLIRPGIEDGSALIEHEITHCRQFYRTFGLHALLYFSSEKYKYKAEVEAYAAQAGVSGKENLRIYARYITELYGLHVRFSVAYEDLKRVFNDSQNELQVQ